MLLLLVVSIGLLFGAGAYMLLRRSFVKLVIGLALLGHAANLLIFIGSDPMRGRPPLIHPGEKLPPETYGDPLPMALILTAIVIGFGITSFTIVLLKRAYQDLGTDDLNTMTTTDCA